MRCAALMIAFTLAGCSKEEPIRVYTAPKPVEPSYRILGGIFPADEPSWFFKVSGRGDELEPLKAEIEKFLATVRLPNGPDNLPVWDLPPGWTASGPNQAKMAAETINFGAFTMTVTPSRGSLDDNLKRWAGQVGLTWQPGEKDKYLKPLGTPPKGWLVDLTGPNNPAARGPMMGK